MIVTNGFGNAAIGDIRTRFSITGANIFQFDAVDVETFTFFNATFARDDVYLVAPRFASIICYPFQLTPGNTFSYLSGLVSDRTAALSKHA